jgi:hypothetical protein
MVAGKLKLLVEQGATFIYPLTVSDNGVGRDLTGYDARMKVKYSTYDTTPLLELNVDNGRIVIDPDQGSNPGLLSLVLTAAETAALDFDYAIYDLELDNAGVVERLVQGAFIVSREVTDD